MSLFSRKPIIVEKVEETASALSMILSTIKDEPAKPAAHTQINDEHSRLHDRIARLRYRETELTREIDYLNEERRQTRCVASALEMAAAILADVPAPEISMDTLAAEIEPDLARPREYAEPIDYQGWSE